MLTLQKLREISGGSGYRMEFPTAKQLRESGTVLIQKRLWQDSEISVYLGGNVLYRLGNRSTVFSIYTCKDYWYLSGKKVIHLSEHFFDSKEWYLRLVLEGEDRLFRNQEEKERNKEISYSTIQEEWTVTENLTEFTIEHLIIRDAITEILQILTRKQKEVIQRYYLQGQTQKQISEELGISQQAVSSMLSQAIHRIRKKSRLPESFQ